MFVSVATVSIATAVVTAGFVAYQQRRPSGDADPHREVLVRSLAPRGSRNALERPVDADQHAAPATTRIAPRTSRGPTCSDLRKTSHDSVTPQSDSVATISDDGHPSPVERLEEQHVRPRRNRAQRGRNATAPRRLSEARVTAAKTSATWLPSPSSRTPRLQIHGIGLQAQPADELSRTAEGNRPEQGEHQPGRRKCTGRARSLRHDAAADDERGAENEAGDDRLAEEEEGDRDCEQRSGPRDDGRPRRPRIPYAEREEEL